MTDEQSYRFRGKSPDEYALPDLNPYMKLHREMVPPVVIAEDAPGFRGRWGEAYPDPEQPLHLEVGPGNGFYLAGMAARHPEWNWGLQSIRSIRVHSGIHNLVHLHPPMDYEHSFPEAYARFVFLFVFCVVHSGQGCPGDRAG